MEKMEREVVEIYAQDCRARAQEVFIPFRRLFARRTVSAPTSSSLPAAQRRSHKALRFY